MPYAQLWRRAPHVMDEGEWQFKGLMARAMTIASGASEMQRNIIAQRKRGLPWGVITGPPRGRSRLLSVSGFFRFGVEALLLVLRPVEAALEVADAATERATDLRQPAGPEDQQGNDENDDEFWNSESEHKLPSSEPA